MMKSKLTILGMAAALSIFSGGGAVALTSDDFLAWLKANQTAEVTFKDGETITAATADKIRPFVPLEYQDEMIFDGMEVVVREPTDLSPPAVYQEATEKFKGQATLAADGALENYAAGRPFDPETFVPGDEISGIKAAWNFEHRWQYQGLSIPFVHWVWVRAGGNHDGHEAASGDKKEIYGGGGRFERALSGPYRRVYFSHRADLASTGYEVGDDWSKGTLFRELTAFDAPFDIAGTAFMIQRYNDPHKADDSWAYIPSLRRVRRISAEVKSDSLLGTDHTLEDFYCFAGRVLEHKWKYLGTARILAVARSRNLETHYYGPNGWTPKDDWELRKVDVYQQIPQFKSHPYSHKYIMTDRQSNESYYCNAFDKKGELWKVWQLSKVWTEDPHYVTKVPQTPAGTRAGAFQSINVIDKQNGRGTLVPIYPPVYRDTPIHEARRELDVNRLTEGR